MKTVVYATSVKGYKHYVRGTECQDRHSFEEKDFSDDEIKVIAISDGHGGAPYCRSAEGAALAVEIAKREIYAFVSRIKETLDEIDSSQRMMNVFPRKILRKVGERLHISSEAALLKEHAKLLAARVESELETVKKDILDAWRAAVDRAFAANPIEVVFSETHRLGATGEASSCARVGYGSVQEKTVLLQNLDLSEDVVDRLVKNPRELYGATLLAAAQYKRHLFLFALGDGDAVLLDAKGGVESPLPKVEYQLANATDSLCQRAALARFRSRYLQRRVKMVMLSTDGVGNAFESDDVLDDVARNLYDSIDEEAEIYRRELAAFLCRCAGGGASGDDCTIGFIANGVREESFLSLKNTVDPQEDTALYDAYAPLLEEYTLDRTRYGLETDEHSGAVLKMDLRQVGLTALRKSLLKDRYVELIDAKRQLEALSSQNRLLSEILAGSKRYLDAKEAALKQEQEAAYRKELESLLAEAPPELIKLRSVTLSAEDGEGVRRSESAERTAIVLSKKDRVIEIADVTPQLYERMRDSLDAMMSLRVDLSIAQGYKLNIDHYNFTIKKEN